MTYKPPGGCDTQPEIIKYWDPTRIACAQRCWRKHWLTTVRGLRPNGEYNVHFEWGSAKHECDQRFDDLIIKGVPREEAAKKALWLAEQLSWDAEKKQPKWGGFLEVVRCSSPEFVPGIKKPGVLIANRKRCKFAKKWFDFDVFPLFAGRRCACGLPVEVKKEWVDDHSKKNRANLLAAVQKYCETPGLPPYKFPNGEATTEVQHVVPLPLITPDEDPCQLVVNIDSIVDHHGWAAIRERKTTGLPKLDFKFWKTYRMNPQIDTYDIAGSIVYADGERIPKLLVEATRIAPNGEVEIQREVIEISEERRAEWFEEMVDIIEEAQNRGMLVVNGEDPERAFPRNTSACHSQFGTCSFWGKVCTQASSKREEMIAEHFHVEHWDPLKATSVVEAEE